MKTYEFTLKYRLNNKSTPNKDDIEMRLFEAGCDDALVGIGAVGRLALAFSREASSAHEAVTSALANVQTALPGADLIEAAPDWVGLTDIADILQCSRQNVRKWIMTHPDTFPVPVHEGKLSMWHLYPVLDWYIGEFSKPVNEDVLHLADVAMQVNLLNQAKWLKPPPINKRHTPETH